MLETPVRLSATSADEVGFSVLAGLSRDAKTIQVMVSNYEIHAPLPPVIEHLPHSAPVGYRMKIDHLPWSQGEFTWKKYRVNDRENFNLVAEGKSKDGSLEIQSDLSAPGFELIVLSKGN